MKNNSTISQELLETVERYYNNSMASKERIDFEEKLQKDPEFKSQVEDIKTLLLGIENQSLKEQLDEFHKDIPLTLSNNTSTKHKLLQFVKYAVAAVIVISIGSYWYFSKPSNEKLYAKYFVADPGLPTTMSANDSFEFYDAMVNYKHGDYKLSISKWKKLLQQKPENDTLNYFLGSAYLANNNAEKAIPLFKKTASQTKSIFNSDANFYLGLAYLKTNNIKLAIEYLKLNHSEKSIELLDKLK